MPNVVLETVMMMKIKNNTKHLLSVFYLPGTRLNARLSILFNEQSFVWRLPCAMYYSKHLRVLIYVHRSSHLSHTRTL